MRSGVPGLDMRVKIPVRSRGFGFRGRRNNQGGIPFSLDGPSAEKTSARSRSVPGRDQYNKTFGPNWQYLKWQLEVDSLFDKAHKFSATSPSGLQILPWNVGYGEKCFMVLVPGCFWGRKTSQSRCARRTSFRPRSHRQRQIRNTRWLEDRNRNTPFIGSSSCHIFRPDSGELTPRNLKSIHT